MWRLMSRSVGTYFFIAHWEFSISLDACLGVCFYLGHWHVDYDACLSWLRIPIVAIFLVLHCYYLFGDIDMLIMLIVHLTLLSIVTLILPCLFWLSHMYRLTIVYHLIWHDWFSQLYIILFIMEHAIIVRYSYRLACV